MNICHLSDDVCVIGKSIGRLKQIAKSLNALRGHEEFVDHVNANNGGKAGLR